MKYELLKKEFGRYASWACWDSNDINILPDDHTPKKPQYMFVGLNASQAEDGRIWGNFHYRHRGGKDGNLRDAIMGTEFEGAYLTDILKYPNEPIAHRVRSHFKKHPDELKQHFDVFYKEITLLEDVDCMFVFGKDAQHFVEQFMKYMGNDVKMRRIKVIPLVHYSAPKMYKRGAYREHLLNVIEALQLGM